ncbi:MAG: hypothetical protein RQ743_10205 [Bacteroidales bacterium]|nr:hypothetical protein [Bacteroidales bacterium]
MNIRAVKMLLVVFALNSAVLAAQSRREIREMFYEAGTWMLFEEYEDALPLYLNLLEIDPDNYNYKYRIGLCYLNIIGEKEKSLPYLEDASRHINPDYREGKLKERGAPYEVLFHLATAYRISNQIDRALDTYRQFYEGMDTRLYDSTTVKQHISYCLNAKQFMDKPYYLKLENQGRNINSQRSDVNPVVSASENTLVFTRELPFYKGIFHSRKENDGWSPVRQLQEELLIDDGYSTSLSNDGTELYIYRNDGYDGNIYFSRYSNGRWSPAQKLNENINTRYWESHASISPDGDKLYFTSNRRGGYGGLDIYVSEKDSLGDWGPAVNLGPAINTPFNEETPFIDSSGKKLYFSSRGHKNMGGYDIFYSTKMDSRGWSEPLNMGFPLNSTDDDLFFSPVGKAYSAYISRIEKGGFGKKDIYKLAVFSDKHPRTLSARGIVKIKDLANWYEDSVKISALAKPELDTLISLYSEARSGRYEFDIKHGEYKLIYESDGSKKLEKDVVFDLMHPGDTVDLPYQELPKSDFTASLSLSPADSLDYTRGDTAVVYLELEPRSLLIVEHRINDSLADVREYFINDPAFTFKTEALAGDNTLTFMLKDRFNNLASRAFEFTVSEPVKIQAVSPGFSITRIDAQQIEEQERTLDSLDAIYSREAESIDRMGQVINEVSTADESRMIKDAVVKTNELKIKHAGEWLQSMFAVAIEDGAEKEFLTRLIAAMSADHGDNAQEYINSLAGFAGSGLKETLGAMEPDNLNIKKPEDVIDYLLSNAGKAGYNKNEIFITLSKLINSSGKTADEILNYLDAAKRLKLWGLWILLGGMMIILVILGFKREKKKKDKTETQ